MTYDKNDVLRLMRDKFEPFGFSSHLYPNAIGMWPNEQESLLWLALNSDQKCNFMEIGSFCGGSAVLMCIAKREMGAGDTKVISVDRTFEDFNNAFQRNVYRVGKFDDISVMCQCDSQDLDKHYSGEPLSLVLIDGWHSFKAVLRDFEMVNRWLVPGGYVAFHDVHPQPYQDGQLDMFCARARENFHEWMAEELAVPDTSVQSAYDYHMSERQQNFFIDEAVAYIAKTCQFDLVDIPVLDGSTHFDRVPEYRHGTTSPFHGLVALQKPGVFDASEPTTR